MKSRLIYFAVEEEYKIFLEKYLLENYPNSKIKDVSENNDILPIIQSEFFLFIVTIDRLQNFKQIQQLQLGGMVYVLDKNSPYSVQEINHCLRVYKDVFNFELINMVNGSPLKEQKDHKEDNSTSVPLINKEKSKPKQVSEPKPSLREENESVTLNEYNHFNPIILEKYPETIIEEKAFEDKYIRAHEVVKVNFLYNKSNINKKIAFWSPLHTSDTVFHILFNFAIYVARYNISVGVLEPISKYPLPLLELTLSQYTQKPKGWIHAMEPYFSEKDFNPHLARWQYKNVDWHPLNNEIISQKWTDDDISVYMNVISNCNVGLVIFPEGRMDPYYIEKTLSLIHELWVFVDHRKQLFQWTQFIKELDINYPNLQIKLVYYDGIEENRAKHIADEMGYPLVSVIPPIHSEILDTQLTSKILLESDLGRKKLEPAFKRMFDNLHLPEKENSKKRIWEILKGFFL